MRSAAGLALLAVALALFVWLFVWIIPTGPH